MMIATQITLLIIGVFFFLACLSSKTEKRGYMFFIGMVMSFVLLLITLL
jgi:hypothetical protein